MAVPNNDTFSLQDVVDEINPTTDDLVDCISDATEGNYDTNYFSSPATSLLEFRNYGFSGILNLTETDIRNFSTERGTAGQWYADIRIIGDKLYYSDDPNKKIVQYSLSIPDDVNSTWTLQGSSSSFSFNYKYMFFDSTGTKLFLFNDSNDTLYRFNLTTAWDITTVNTTAEQSLVVLYSNILRNIDVNYNGTEIMFTHNNTVNNTDLLSTIPLSVGWDLSSNGTVTEQDITSALFYSQWAYVKRGTDEFLLSAGTTEVAVLKKNGSTWEYQGQGDITGAYIVWINCNNPDYVYCLAMNSTGGGNADSRIIVYDIT